MMLFDAAPLVELRVGQFKTVRVTPGMYADIRVGIQRGSNTDGIRELRIAVHVSGPGACDRLHIVA